MLVFAIVYTCSSLTINVDKTQAWVINGEEAAFIIESLIELGTGLLRRWLVLGTKVGARAAMA